MPPVRRAGGRLEQVSPTLTSSPEYWQVRGGGTNDGFIAALYNDALRRSPDRGGLTAHTQALKAGMPPRQVASGILASTENFQGQVANAYQECLKRAPDDGALNAYVKS